MRSIKLFLGLLATGLVVLLPGLAHAQSAPDADAEGRRRGFEGEVVNGVGVPGGEGTLTIRDARTEEERVIRLTSRGGQANYTIKTPGNPEVSDVARSMSPGTPVAVLARRVGGQWLAEEVLVKPEEPTIAPRTGVVMGSNPEEGTVTILTSSGISRTLQLEAGAPSPAHGDLVIAFAGPSRRASSSLGLERVTGLTRAAEVRERLERDLEEVTSGEGDLKGVDSTVKANHAESLMDLLEHQTSSHFKRLEKALKHSTSGNKRALVEAIVHTGEARNQGRIKAQVARATIAKDSSEATARSAQGVVMAKAAEAAARAADGNSAAEAAARAAEDAARDEARAAEAAARAAEAAARAAEDAARAAASNSAAEDTARAAEDAARAEARAAEAAARTAEDAARDEARAAEAAARAAEDAARAAEDAARDEARAAEAAARAAEAAARAAGGNSADHGNAGGNRGQ